MARKSGNPIFLFFFGLLFGCIGVAVILFFACKTTMTCVRISADDGACKLVHEKILGTDTVDIPLNHIHEAYVDEHSTEDGYTYAVMLVTEKGEINMHNAYSSGREEKAHSVSEINTFIRDKALKDLVVYQDDRWLIYLIGGIFTLVGFGMTIGSVFSIITRL